MPPPRTADSNFLLTPGEFVVLEEIFFTGWPWDHKKRTLVIPEFHGANVYFRHNYGWPPFLFENRFSEGAHGITLPANTWHKVQVRNDSNIPIGITYIVNT